MISLIAHLRRRYVDALKLEHLPMLERARARVVIVLNVISLAIASIYIPVIILAPSYEGSRLLNLSLLGVAVVILCMNTALARRGRADLAIQIINLLIVLCITAGVLMTEQLEPRLWKLVLVGLTSFFVTRPAHVVLMALYVVVCAVISQAVLTGTAPDEFLRDEMARVMISCLMLMVLAYMKSRTHARYAAKLHHNHKVIQQAAQEAERHRAELVELLDHARHADQLKSRFLADMSHELRTPLNAILGYTELLHEDIDEHEHLPDTVRSDAEMIQTASHHLLSLIDDVLDLEEIEQGELRFRPHRFDLIEVLGEVIVAMSHAARRRGNKLLLTHTSSIFTLRQDPTLVRQLMFNFVSNAIKFTDHGLIEVEVLAHWRGGVSVRIMDTGLGMSAEDLEAIREEFTQADAQSIKEYGGTGLGLPLCYALVEKMGGTLDIQSAPGEGTDVTLTLPDVPQGGAS